MLETNLEIGFPAADDNSLLEDSFLEKLEGLHFVLQRLATAREGDWSSNMTGQGLEFVDYRRYIAGDDLRLLDWKAYLRLGQLIIRICQVERGARVLILVDASRSMVFGRPSKWGFALRAAAALCYISLFARDALLVGAFDGNIGKRSRIFSGRRAVGQVLEFLSRLSPSGVTSSLELFCQDLACLRREFKPSLTVVLSDFLHGDLLPAVEECHRFRDLFFLQILAPQELTPSLNPDSYQLVDSESGDSLPLQWGDQVNEDYQKNLSRFLQQFDQACADSGVANARCATDLEFEDLVLELLHSRGLIA